jgi:hypothetical protein
VSLDELDRRASLRKRIDHKYFVGLEDLSRLLDQLRGEYDVLEIDSQRTFEYRSVYFDTPELTAFHDHINDRTPRCKLRTRSYVTTGKCVFEVKVKRANGETSKRSVDHDCRAEDRLDDADWALIEETLPDAGIDVPDELRPTLVSHFHRSTLALKEHAERVTIDRDLRLSGGDSNRSLVMHDDYALLETKTPDGHGRCDRALADAGVHSVSFSKYRLGVARLIAHEDHAYVARVMRYFRGVRRLPNRDSGRAGAA